LRQQRLQLQRQRGAVQVRTRQRGMPLRHLRILKERCKYSGTKRQTRGGLGQIAPQFFGVRYRPLAGMLCGYARQIARRGIVARQQPAGLQSGEYNSDTLGRFQRRLLGIAFHHDQLAHVRRSKVVAQCLVHAFIGRRHRTQGGQFVVPRRPALQRQPYGQHQDRRDHRYAQCPGTRDQAQKARR
jgi:hypothetical protein